MHTLMCTQTYTPMSNPSGKLVTVKEEPGLERANPPQEPSLSEQGMRRKIKEQTAYIDMLEADQVYNADDRQGWRRTKVEMQIRISSLEDQLEAAMQIQEILSQTKHTAEILARILDPAPDHKRPRKE